MLTTAPENVAPRLLGLTSVIIMQLPSRSCGFTGVSAGACLAYGGLKTLFLLYLTKDSQTSQASGPSPGHSSRQARYSAKTLEFILMYVNHRFSGHCNVISE